jgi:pimeloyl-ACP methyl ester carboxylesterase
MSPTRQKHSFIAPDATGDRGGAAQYRLPMAAREHAVAGPAGRTLRVREDGDPGGVPLVVHHGTPGSRLLPRRSIADARERGIRLIGYDRPGYGGSDRHAGRAVADAAADVEAIADALGLDRLLTRGSSGGGPHALACAALLGDRVAAAATLAGAAPHDVDGLDWLAGMGEDNVREFTAALAGPEALAPVVEGFAAEVLAAGPDDVVAALRSLLSPPDVAVLTGEMAEDMVSSLHAGVGERRDGWVDDDLAFAKPWGFSLEEISVPVLLWQGRQDLMVPPAHGEWLAGRIAGVEPHLSDADGHLTLAVTRLGEVHAWLLERF